MDDSATNNPFNNPVTGADKNDDFLMEVSPVSLSRDMKDAETKGVRIENPAGGEKESKRSHKDKLPKKAREVMRRRAHESEAASHEGSNLRQVQREVDAAKSADEARKDAEEAVKDATMFGKLLEFGRKFNELGGPKRFPEAYSVIMGASLSALTVFLAHKGFDSANYIPDLTKGVIAGISKKPITEALEHHGVETKKKGVLPLIEKSIGAVAGALSLNNFGEAVAVHDATDLVLEGVGLFTSAGIRISDRLRPKKAGEAHIAASSATVPSSEPVKTSASPPREPVATPPQGK